jgi:hypothetical protein
VKSRHLTTAALSLMTAFALAVAGCGGSDGAGANNKPAAQVQDPTTALAEASKKLSQNSFAVNATLGTAGTMTGKMDPAGNRGVLSSKVTAEGTTVKFDIRVIDTDFYLKMDVGGAALPGMDPKKWIHLDGTKLPANSSLGVKPGELDPANAEKVLKAATKVERVGDRGFKGTLDFSKLQGVAGISKKDVTGLADKGKSVPFEARVDDQGRLVNMKVDVPKVPGVDIESIDVTYSDFGTKVDVQKPAAGEVNEAPAMVYEMFATKDA